MKNLMKDKKFKDNFDNPPNRFMCNHKLSKYQFEKIEIEPKEACIFLLPITAQIDRYLMSKCMRTKFVFLKQELIFEIIDETISKTKYNELVSQIELLCKNQISVAIQFNKSPSIFGDHEKIDKNLAMFLFDTKQDLKTIIFPNEFFVSPMWANEKRKAIIYASQKLGVKHQKLVGLTQQETINEIQNITPSGAIKYTKSYPISLKSNNLAEHLEQIIYCCPSCKKFFSIYSECSCLKCKNCGSVIEIDNRFNFLFSKHIETIDDIKTVLYKIIPKADLSKNLLIEYNDLSTKNAIFSKKITKNAINMQIFAEKIILTVIKDNKQKTIKFEDINEINLYFNNSVIIKYHKNKEIILIGNGKENFYILKDLLKLNTN